MYSELRGWLVRRTHRLHRLVGSVLCLVLAMWFGSGIVMTFATFPLFDEAERLAANTPLESVGDDLPPELVYFTREVPFREGAVITLAMVEGEPRWLFRNAHGERLALRTVAPYAVVPLDDARARRIAHHPRVLAERLDEPDQWTVNGVARGAFPLFRLFLDDAEQTELYVSARTGEVLQQTTFEERVLAWLGPIPHWVYPTLLRRERALWRSTVLWLAGFGLLVTSSGLVSGLHTRRQLRRAGRQSRDLKDPALRWHHRIGLGFGFFASSWLFSGALSLSPFAWTGDGASEAQLTARIHLADPAQLRPQHTLEVCRRELDVRELQFRTFGGSTIATCLGAHGASRVVLQTAGGLVARERLPHAVLARAASQAAGTVRFTVREHEAPDAYYYANHDTPTPALPYARVELDDAARSTIYLDTRRPDLLAVHTTRTRVERWLYHGLHSLDLPALQRHPGLRKATLIVAMSLGLGLSLLGFAMLLRRYLPRKWWAFRAKLARRGRPS